MKFYKSLGRSTNCKHCGKKGRVLHHKNGNKSDQRLENLVVLCGSCHTNWHYKNGDFSNYTIHRGKSVKEWAKIKGMSYNGILMRLKKHGSVGKWGTKFERLYGETAQKLGDKLGCSREWVRQLHEAGKLKSLLAIDKRGK